MSEYQEIIDFLNGEFQGYGDVVMHPDNEPTQIKESFEDYRNRYFREHIHMGKSSEIKIIEDNIEINAFADFVNGIMITISKTITLENLESKEKLIESIEAFGAHFPDILILPHFSLKKGGQDLVKVIEMFSPGINFPSNDENQQDFYETLKSALPKIQQKSTNTIESILRTLQVYSEEDSNDFFTASKIFSLLK
ncbi:unnamed protein product [Moneuplotes crassus]|uniref:Uncharacterized protein n=1 Tax=Euplotes crassus TaxID=5936 RepID=A0AAD1UKU5_EUPCR|nr:unnamed protein product [Moneuplotes crassus]